MSCGVGHRLGLDLTLLWLWRRPAAVAPPTLPWEYPYHMAWPWGGKKMREKEKKRKKERKEKRKGAQRDVKYGKDSPSHCCLGIEEGGHGPGVHRQSLWKLRWSPWEKQATSVLQPQGTGLSQQPECPWKQILFWRLQKGMQPCWHFDFDHVRLKPHYA